MPHSAVKALAILQAKKGLEQALRDFTLDVAPEIHSRRYVAGPLYSRISPQLEDLVQERLLLLAEPISD